MKTKQRKKLRRLLQERRLSNDAPRQEEYFPHPIPWLKLIAGICIIAAAIAAAAWLGGHFPV